MGLNKYSIPNEIGSRGVVYKKGLIKTLNTKLIEGCISNNRDAQEALYKQCYAELLRLCMRYLKDDDLAKDALNMGFLKVFNCIEEYNVAKGKFMPWIKTIMIRTCIDLQRKEFRLKQLHMQNEVDEEIHPSVFDKLYAEDILLAIRKLPAATQAVFNLSVIDGYSHHEIGQMLAIGESTSRWHLSTAKKQLRLILIEAGIVL